MLNLFLDIIPMKKSKPIRMCITCRDRKTQNSLLRLKLSDTVIIKSDGKGRSIYLCKVCAEDEKKIKGLSKRFKQDKECFFKLLKELVKNG